MKRILFICLILCSLLPATQAQGYRGYYITGHNPRNQNCNALYLLGLQTDMLAYVTFLGLDPQELLPTARRSITQVNGQWLWIMDAVDISLRDIEKGRRDFNIFILPQSYASQLGAPFELVKGANGNALIDGTGAYILTEKEEIINWLWCMDSQSSPPVDFATNQAILNWITAGNLRTKWETLFDAFEEPYGP